MPSKLDLVIWHILRTMIPARIIITLSLVASLSEAFTVPVATSFSRGFQTHHEVTSCNPSPRHCDSVVLGAAKKRRRRRKDTPISSSSDQPSVESSASLEDVESDEAPFLASNELPDFDLGDDEEAPAPKKPKINPGEISANMMGSGNMAASSVNELLFDRSLESKFEFDDAGDPNIPDFVDLAKASSTTPTYSSSAEGGMGKKKQRQAERVANAIAAKEAEQSEEPFLKNFPQLLDEKGNVSFIKILEQGGKNEYASSSL